LPLTFGLGKSAAGKPVSLEIAWPSGQKDAIPNIQPNQSITVQEGKGIIAARPIAFSPPGANASAKSSKPAP
jgi:enediyne biosynthesis protein E4